MNTLHYIFRLKKTLENGVEKGYWNLVTGNPSSGTYELAMEEFDPTDGRFYLKEDSYPVTLTNCTANSI